VIAFGEMAVEDVTRRADAAHADGLARLREEVRTVAAEAPSRTCDSWLRAFDPAFSDALGRRGWIGMTVPPRFGGHGRSNVERYVVTEELLAAGAPVAYHWFADRQVAPTLLASGNERLRDELIPPICRGEICVCIGISEPNAGSDVAAVATTAHPDGDRWRITGQKVWTTGAMHAQYCYLLARTERHENRHQGLSEFVVPMDADGITVRPIEDLAGEAHFAEIFFEDVAVDGWRLVGEAGQGFRQIVRQLDYERSGPERFLSTMPLLDAVVRQVRRNDAHEWAPDIGKLVARLSALRQMAFTVAQSMDAGAPPSAYSALVKDLGAKFEQDVVSLAVDALDDLDPTGRGEVEDRLREGLLYQPTFTLRGGTAEILREVVARRMLKLQRSD
jgi:alkylation response protein AidB-like acyl-CoA dehydrogenase